MTVEQDIQLIPSADSNRMNGCPTVAAYCASGDEGAPVLPRDTDIPPDNGTAKSEGTKEVASVAGCNANNANASARTLNGNNALSNSNDNYAGAFAVTKVHSDTENGKHRSSQASSLNTTEDLAATGAQGQPDYESLPYWNSGNAEKDATATVRDKLLRELSTANSKRKLKNLKRFFVDRYIVSMGVDRCLNKAAHNRQRAEFIEHRDEVIDRIVREMEDGSYRCRPPTPRTIRKKGCKDRQADIYELYDRCVQNVMLIVLQKKLKRLILRNCYSGITGRSILSNNRTYCMANKIRHYVSTHPDAYGGLTDIRKFYESLRSDVVLGVLFKTVTCPFTRYLLVETLKATETLPIGGTLSQLLAMAVLADMDMEIIRRFHPQFYAGFGDNRIFMDTDKQKVIDIMHFEISYIEGRFGMSVKDDRQIVKVKDGFRFCKYDYNSRYVNVRGELRRRAIKGAIRGPQHYAGYKGILMKTDSKRLRGLIENHLTQLRNHMKNSKGMTIKKMVGDVTKINTLVGKTIVITDWKRVNNDKESEYYIRFQFILLEDNGKKSLKICNNGSQEIKEFFRLVQEGQAQIGKKMRVMQENNAFFFEGYHTSSQEVLEILCSQYDV
jgi:retron-type reverse transcriptase